MGNVGVLAGRTAVELADLVRRGKATPAEVVRAHLERIREVDGAIGAFQVVREDRALEEAERLAVRTDLADLPLAGVPVPIKDLIPVAGEPMRVGSAATPEEPQPADHPVVARIRDAGGVVVGLTRMPELGTWATTESALGVTRNPWDPTRTPGGSSGGAAAAVAAGMVPVAHGTDGLGSIRIPAAACGVFGIKPGPGVVPPRPGVAEWYGMTESGSLAGTVADAALLLAVMAGRPDLQEVPPAASRLRVAVSVTSPLVGAGVDPEVRAAVMETARLLGEAGHDVRRADPPYATRHAAAVVARWFGAVADEVREAGLDPARLERRTRTHARIGQVARRLVRARQRDAWRARVARFFDRVDLLLTPTLAGPALPLRDWHRRGWLANVWRQARWAPFPGAWNFSGNPAASVPAGLHSTGLPMGVQLVGPEGGERVILAVARQLEELRPWPRTAPAVGR